MLPTLTLSVAVLAFVLALVAVVVALLALGMATKATQVAESQRSDLTSLNLHRVRVDQNIAALASHIASMPASIVVATPPGRPQ